MPRFSADMVCARVAGLWVLAFAMATGELSVSHASLGDTLDLPSSATRGARVAVPAEGVRHLNAESLRRFATLEDALASLPGFRVRRAGGLGGYSELSFRGARASAVAVYVDGVRLNQEGEGAPDLSKWPALWFSSLTARTGFDAAGASPGSLARIDLSTHSQHRAEAHARGGSFEVGEIAAQASFPLTPIDSTGWRLTVGAQAQTARNDYPVFSDKGTLYNTADDTTYNLNNNAYQSRGARAAVRRAYADGVQQFSVLWLDSRKEYPGLFPTSARAHTVRTDWLGAWRVSRSFVDVASYEVGAQARRLEDSYRDPNQSLGVFSFEQARVSTAGELDGALNLPFRVGGRHTRAEAADERFTGVARADVRLRAEDITPTATPFNQEMASPAAERFEASAGLRANLVTARAFPAVWRDLALTLEARPSWVRFKADGVRSFPGGPLSAPLSQTFAPVAWRAAAEWPTRIGTWGALVRTEPRAPSSGEFLGDNNGIQHNSDLRAEEARSVVLMHAFEMAGTQGSETVPAWSAGLETSVYANTYDDPIRLGQRGASPFLRYENAAAYEVQGVEWTARVLAPYSESLLSFSLQDATINEGQYEGNRPAHLSETEAHAEFFLKPLKGSRIGALADYRGAYFPGDANVPVSRRDAEWELGAHAGYARGPARFALDARNLFDKRYRDFAHSPRSGRSWSFTMSFAL
jgi:hypothetical protein